MLFILYYFVFFSETWDRVTLFDFFNLINFIVLFTHSFIHFYLFFSLSYVIYFIFNY